MTTAYLIIDVQKGILDGAGTAERQAVLNQALDEVVDRLHHLQNQARRANVPIVVVQHNDQGDHRLAMGSPGWELRPEIASIPSDAVIHKIACDAFFETDLQDQLQRLGATHLVIGGCMTQYCVDTTVRRAVTMGYDVTLLSDCHMTGDAGALAYDQIIAHHNIVLNGFDAGPKKVRLKKASEIQF